MESEEELESTSEVVDTPRSKKSASWKITLVVCAVIAAAVGGLLVLTFSTEPEAERGGATKKTAMLVEVVEVERGDFRPTIQATGTVQAAEEVEIEAQVGGKITKRGENFVPGGYVEKGDLLVAIEAADLRNQLAQARSDVDQAEAALAEEMGRQAAARGDYEFLGEKLPEEQERLILRKPQLAAAKQRVEAMEARVDQLQLEIRRTRVTAPFDAQVLRRDVAEGSVISPNETIGRLVGIDHYWVAAEVPLSKLPWIEVPKIEGEEGATVKIMPSHRKARGDARTGRLFRLVGALDPQTRMARVLVRVDDPLARQEGNLDLPALMLGEFVNVSIEGTPVPDVVKLPRDYLRPDDTVWVMKDGKLHIAKVDVVTNDLEHVYVATGLEDGAKIVTTNLSTVVDGAPLRLEGEPEGGAAAPEDEASGE